MTALIPVAPLVRRVRARMACFIHDRRGVAAIEFSFIAPVMLTLMFGLVEISSGVAIDRKVTLVAHTLSDLVSQKGNVAQSDLQNFFGMSTAIMSPYPVSTSTLTTQRVSAVWIYHNKVAKVVWSYTGSVSGNTATVASGYSAGTTITTIPAELLIPDTELIWSEVTYNYDSVLRYIIKTPIHLSDQFYTRPRLYNCVSNSNSSNSGPPTCPSGSG